MDLESCLIRLTRGDGFHELANLADATMENLQAVRQSGSRAARRGALLALLHLGGENALAASDQAVLRRLLRVKALQDVPYAFDACFNQWLMVRGGDQAGIMRVLGLSDAMPAKI